MDFWIWCGFGVVLTVLEIITVSFYAIFMAFGAFVTAIVMLIFPTCTFPIQIAIFASVSILSLVFLKPVFKKVFKINVSKKVSNVYAFQGKNGVVVSEITEFQNGLVKVDGSNWSAKSEDGQSIPVGTAVEVLSVDGVKLIVKVIEKL